MKSVRLILGDQLNPRHSWYNDSRSDVLYLMAELRQETDYVRHHRQKVLGFFACMRAFAERLEKNGHRVRYFRITDPDNPQNLVDLLRQVLQGEGAVRLEYQEPDEYRLDAQLRTFADTSPWECTMVPGEHFLTTRMELSEFFKGKKQLLMESFYRHMRKKHQILMHGGQPEGGQWNFDQLNRSTWKGVPEVPPPLSFRHNLTTLDEAITQAGVQTLGAGCAEAFPWPITPEEAREVLAYFCQYLLPHFGDFQDAMHTEEPFLFHSRLSFALNTKMISPMEVVGAALATYRKNPETIHISQVEGFVRQIIGWREYIRGVYWKEMPGYEQGNALGNHNPLPEWYWTGKTNMTCLSAAIRQSLALGYAHHIQRLMITGNFALLLETDPRQIDAWYLGIYIDAIQWVEIPNTLGMSQYADGGLLATKPYISSANYIHKMSNYCGQCPYDRTQRTGPKACPFNALYWDFLESKRPQLGGNPRMGMMYRLLDKISTDEREAIRQRAAYIREHVETL